MGLIKSSLVSGIGVLVRLLAQLGLNKVLAVYLGPSGFALVGQYQSILQILSIFSSSTLGNGVVKSAAQVASEKSVSRETIDIWRASVIYSLFSTVVVLFLAYFYGDYIAVTYLGNVDFANVPLYFAASFIFFCCNNILISILNGYGHVFLIMISNVSGSVISLVLVFLLVSEWQLLGALIALSIYQGVWFFVTLFISLKFKWCVAKNFIGATTKEATKFLSGFVAMSLITAICVPVAQLYLRNLLINDFSTHEAGYWEAMQRLSVAYLSLVTTVLSIYYLPKFVRIEKYNDLIDELKKGYLLICPFLMIILIGIFYLRDGIVVLVYSQEFGKIGDIIGFQLVGDFFKICSWLLSYYLVAKSEVKIFIRLELVFTFSYLVLTEYFVTFYGFEYVAFGYLLNYILYFFVLVFLFVKKDGYLSRLKESSN